MSTPPPGLRPVSNPPNPWASTDVEYLDEVMGDDGPERAAPNARLTVFEDATRSIIATNDSPDVGFRWSVNPYRGCWHACAYCQAGDTPILMADGTTRRLEEVRTGDAIYGTQREGRYRRYVQTTVVAAWTTVRDAYRIELEDGTELVASGDHRYLTHRGWKYVTGAQQGHARRPHLTLNDELLGTGRFTDLAVETNDYRLGYLTGMVRGDCAVRSGDEVHGGRVRGTRRALVDMEALRRTRRYLDALDSAASDVIAAELRDASAEARASNGEHHGQMAAMTVPLEGHAPVSLATVPLERAQQAARWPAMPSLDWAKGFLAGLFDAEGTYSRGILRIAGGGSQMMALCAAMLEALRFDATLEDRSAEGLPSTLRVRGGLAEHLRFFHATNPAVSRKKNIAGAAVKTAARLRVVAIRPLSARMRLHDITTGTGDFIANGVVSHNCYARPGHEYLSMGAGTDFDRKIVVKPEAPRLLREAFEARSWKGEFVMFSGVTDCYQPLEASYRITRGCLEVCAEYRNPCGVITKAPLIERDLDLLVELGKVADFGVTLSIPLWDPAKARAIEPYVATPQRRMRTVERLAKAGVRVGVNVAPLIPGLGDEDMPAILQAAHDAGASHAGFVFLRLPGPVAPVFVDRLRAALPLRAEKVLARVREARGGKLYDSTFGARKVGDGPYAAAAMALFETTCRRLGLSTGNIPRPEAPPTFQRPARRGDQMKLF
ncbi:MAG: radical SAM protein [Polyangiaceae bacterium]